MSDDETEALYLDARRQADNLHVRGFFESSILMERLAQLVRQYKREIYLARIQGQAEMIDRLEKGFRSDEPGVWPSWIYEARKARQSIGTIPPGLHLSLRGKTVAVVDGSGEDANIGLYWEQDGELLPISWPSDWPQTIRGLKDRGIEVRQA